MPHSLCHCHRYCVERAPQTATPSTSPISMAPPWSISPRAFLKPPQPQLARSRSPAAPEEYVKVPWPSEFKYILTPAALAMSRSK